MRLAAILGLAALAASTAATAQITRVSEGDFTASAGLITFGEVPLGTANPTYLPALYGGGVGAPTVTFDGYFVGQSLSASPGTDCPGAAASACVVGNPSGPLALDPTAPDTFTTTDGAPGADSPVLSGTPTFNGPIAVLFSNDQAGVGFDAGFFDDVGSTAITAFDRNGNLLGSVTNTGTGFEFLGLVTNDGSAQIAGVFLDLVGAEGFGFEIDNLRFGLQGEVVVPPNDGVPEPATWAMLVIGFGAIGWQVRRRRNNHAIFQHA